MATKNFKIGSPITVEVQFYRREPYGTPTLFDPTTATISVYKSGQSKDVTDEDLIKSETGKYYYVIQTTTSWATGNYSIWVQASDGTYDDDEVLLNAFTLE